MANATLRYRINSVGVAAVSAISYETQRTFAQKSMANATLRYQQIT
jgi:hypothetical protein